MEQRKSSMFFPLLKNSLESKKNWFFLSAVVIFVSTLLVPFILNIYDGFFIGLGIFEMFVLVFINCLVDNSFLHNDAKMAYYKSKPATFRDQVLVNTAVNVVLTAYLLILIIISNAVNNANFDLFEVFKLIIPWLLAGIFLASLSSILAGNTLVAGIMTMFNFALPGIIYLILYFMFTILENMVTGFSANVLMQYFVNTVYKLDYIYFSRYFEKPLDCVYFLLLGIILTGIVMLIFKTLKRRKNENTGNFIVFDGYKYFASVLACLIVPAFLSMTLYYRKDIAGTIFASVLMAALTYYLIIAAMEKSFRISRLSIKVFIVSMAVFVAATGGTVLFAGRYRDAVPDAENVKYAYVGSGTWGLSKVREYINENENRSLSSDDMIRIYNSNGIVLFSDKENIKTITDLHKELLKDNNYKNDLWLSSITIVYFMNDGKFMVREYVVDREEGVNETKDELAAKLLNSREFKEINYSYVYNEKYYKDNYMGIDIYIGSDYKGEQVPLAVTMDELRPYLMKDIDKLFVNMDNAFYSLSDYHYEKYYPGYGEMGYYISLESRIRSEYDNSSYEVRTTRFRLNSEFENTVNYLKPELEKLN